MTIVTDAEVVARHGDDSLEAVDLLHAERRIVVGTAMATNFPRVYAVGDIAEYQGKVRLMSVGFGEAATAVNNAVAAL